MTKKPAKKKTTALALRRPRPVGRPVPSTGSSTGLTLTDTPMLGALGVVSITLSKKEEAVLARPVDARRVWMKPAVKDGKPIIPYLPHTEYSRWFNDAFGRLGWRLVPCAKPMLTDGLVTCPYVLFIHGKPATFALGEQEYKNNGNQSYGDAYEATYASALRRVAKHLGVGLELWDRDWLDSNRRYFRSLGDDRGQPAKTQQPAPADRAFYAADDIPYGAVMEDPATFTGLPPAEPAGPFITDKQRRRWWAITKNSGRNADGVHQWMQRRFGITSSSKIPVRSYETICKAIESPDPLPEGGR